jgi:hypothetical protein
MAEPGVPEATMLDIMGHMSSTMLRLYSHIRQEAKVKPWMLWKARCGFAVPKLDAKPELKAAVTH